MQDDPDSREARRRIRDAATGVYFVPGYQGHWVGVLLFAATMVGATMLWTGLPVALAVLGGGTNGAPDGQTATTFLVLYAAMAAGPIGGWLLWATRRRWAAMAVLAIFAVCVVWLSPVVMP